MSETIAVIGLGYVGLPLAVALARKFETVIGYDISEPRVRALQAGSDWTYEISDEELASSTLEITSDASKLDRCSFFIVTVPTPITADRRPDLTPLISACRLIGPHLRREAAVVFESTVYPGVTEDVCAPVLEETSGLVRGRDFSLGYSPERINPGDRVHRLETITKIVAAENAETLRRLEAVYGAVVDAGLHAAPSIKVAEAAKVIENTQRDLNVALMNEISVIFDLMGIRTKDVLAAAGTKWNFLPFTPGLVGGHCIGVDPYYLTAAAEQYGHRPEVILAGRAINDSMGGRVADKLVKLMILQKKPVHDARIGILGLTFKEDVPDLRNSKVPDIAARLAEYGIAPLVHDPHADPEQAEHEFGIRLASLTDFTDLDAVILAVNHEAYSGLFGDLDAMLVDGAIVVDVKSALEPGTIGDRHTYWSL